MTTLATGNAEEDLRACVERFAQFNESESKTADKPNVLYCAFFSFDLDTVNHSVASTLPENVMICSDSPLSASIDYSDQINEAKLLFSKICPGVPFLEKVPDAEDIIWVSY
eukprot:gene19010-22756_t